MTENTPIWMRGVRRTRYPVLDLGIDADVAIVGAGITGLTAALLLAERGERVVVLEAGRVGDGTTGASSAHVTEVPDRGYRRLLDAGEERARALVQRARAGLELIGTLVDAEGIDCDFARVPAYLIGEHPDDEQQLEEECRAAERLGCHAELLADVPLPWSVHGAVRYGRQAAFNPVRYLAGLARVAMRRGATLFESTRVTGYIEHRDRVEIQTTGGEVRARTLILATHTPLGFNLVQTEVAPYRSYVVALRVQHPLEPALIWDTSDPYFYVRHYDHQGTPIAIVGGADHKTGHEPDTDARYAVVEEYARARLGRCTTEHRWSAQLYEPTDELPFIGRAPRAHRVYLATGFSGVGLVQGTMAASELAAAVRGETTCSAFSATRLGVSGVRRFLSENVDVAAHWIGDRLGAGSDLEDVGPGQGRIARVDGKRRAVFRDDNGRLHILSPVCPHMGCIVHWNNSARSWDCPCHGGRFAPTGEVIEGPPLAGLERHEQKAEPQRKSEKEAI
jgi:glycine/D-amino acid oxidase-like deaminating enzyme/nitrite reductase/ring-hydroxylating ferredoxin subunit